MGLLLYGGLGLLPLWLLIALSVLRPWPAAAETADALLWWSVGALPACIMTLWLAEAIRVKRERRSDPWRQQKILAVVLPMLVLLLAAGHTWERQQAQRALEEARIVDRVATHREVLAWLGEVDELRITGNQPNPDLLGEPVRYWVRAESGRRHAVAVVDADRRSPATVFRVACIERGDAGYPAAARPESCRR